MRTRIGKFEILRPLGKGAMGEVFLAVDPHIGRQVAIKTIKGDAAEGPEARERFQREARAAGQLTHPNLVAVHEFGEDAGILYLAMEYVAGEDLERLLRDRSLQPQELLEVLAQVCDGLAYAHARGVLHRDIKPSNIRVIREGQALQAKVMDFGIARLHNSELTGTGTLLGTFGYMAPEYVQTGKPDPRSDLFAVGVILYEALSGRRPFEGDTTATVLYRLVHEEPAPLDLSSLQGVSPKLAQVLSLALAKDPRARYPRAEDLAKALRASKDPGWGGPDFDRTLAAPRPLLPAPPEVAPAPRAQAPLPPAPRASGGRGLRVGLTLAALAVLAAGGGWWGTRPRPVPTISLPPPGPEAPPAAPASGPAAKAPVRRPEGARPPRGPVADPPLSLEEAEAWMDAAAQGLLDTPAQSLKRLTRVIRDHPQLPRARAMQVAALYHAGDYPALVPALEDAKAAGIRPGQLATFGVFKDMLRLEKRDRRLPPEVRAALASELLPPAGARRFRRP